MLEHILRGQLDGARVAALCPPTVYHCQGIQCAKNTAAGSVACGLVVMLGVECVLHFHAQLKRVPLGDAGDLAKADVCNGISRGAEKVAANVTELSRTRREEHALLRGGQVVEPPRVRIEVHLKHIVGAPVAACWRAHDVAGGVRRGVNGKGPSGLNQRAAGNLPPAEDAIDERAPVATPLVSRAERDLVGPNTLKTCLRSKSEGA